MEKRLVSTSNVRNSPKAIEHAARAHAEASCDAGDHPGDIIECLETMPFGASWRL